MTKNYSRPDRASTIYNIYELVQWKEQWEGGMIWPGHQAGVAWFSWPHMKEMNIGSRTGGLSLKHKQAHSEREQSPSCASKSPDGPSALPPCPAWCQASGAHWSPAQLSTHSLAGGQRDSPARRRSNANRYSLWLLCCHMSDSPLNHKIIIIRQTHLRRTSNTVMHVTVEDR